MRIESKAPPSTMIRIVAIVAVGAIAMACNTFADPQPPREKDRTIAQGVSELLSQYHVSSHKLDDEMSERTFRMFFKRLDPYKEYFTAADMKEFLPKLKKLDDELLQGDTNFAHVVFKRFLQRLDEMHKHVDHYLKADHDFTKDETITIKPKAIDYGTSAAEMKERWRKRIKYDLMVEIAGDEKLEEARKTIRQRYRGFKKRMHLTDTNELLEMYLMSMAKAFDPHSSYMSADSLENFMIAMRLQLEGIGAQLRWDDGKTIIVRIIPGGAADKDGKLKASDEIVGVGQGDDGKITDTLGMKLTDVVKQIRGKRGTVVRLKVIPSGSKKAVIYKLTRAKIELKESQARGEVLKSGKKPDGKPYNIGVINVPGFYRDTAAAEKGDPNYRSVTRDVRNLLDKFRNEKVDAVVIDLRENTGGFLVEAIDLTGLFIDKGPVVQVKGIKGRVQTLTDDQPGVSWEGPLVVLTSSLSASASEVFAGAIKDYGRGLIVGNDSTIGKGSVARLLDLGNVLFPNKKENIGALTMCIQQFYRPGGASTQIKGVRADVVLPSLMGATITREKDLDYAMAFSKVDPVEFKPVAMTNPGQIGELRKQSKKRVQQSKEFKTAIEQISRFQKLKKQETVTLNLEKYKALWKDLDKGDKDPAKDPPKKQIVKRDYYFDEVLAITCDYVAMLNSRNRQGERRN